MKACFYILTVQLKTILKIFQEIRFSFEEEAEMMRCIVANVIIEKKKISEVRERIGEIRSELNNLESLIDELDRDPYFLKDILLLKKSS